MTPYPNDYLVYYSYSMYAFIKIMEFYLHLMRTKCRSEQIWTMDFSFWLSSLLNADINSFYGSGRDNLIAPLVTFKSYWSLEHLGYSPSMFDFLSLLSYLRAQETELHIYIAFQAGFPRTITTPTIRMSLLILQRTLIFEFLNLIRPLVRQDWSLVFH